MQRRGMSFRKPMQNLDSYIALGSGQKLANSVHVHVKHLRSSLEDKAVSKTKQSGRPVCAVRGTGEDLGRWSCGRVSACKRPPCSLIGRV